MNTAPSGSVSSARIGAALLLATVLSLPLWGVGAGCFDGQEATPLRFAAAVAPKNDAVYTATRDVTGLLVTSDGSVWAATGGGILRRTPDGAWRKWTRFDGLPSHEARAVRLEAGRVVAVFPGSEAVWNGQSWAARTVPLDKSEVLSQTTWHGATYRAMPDGLRCGAKNMAYPPSDGSHASALLSGPGALWVAMYGDGLWCWDEKWSRAPLTVPAEAREITALAGTPQSLWVGTRRAGVWHWDGKAWTQHLQPDEPFNTNVQWIARWGSVEWVSTLEDGLLARTGEDVADVAQQGEWRHWGRGVLSSDAPRHLVAFHDALYVRHGSGQVDEFDGQSWQRDVLAGLPRRRVFALASDENHLYAAQWGGWSVWGGKGKLKTAKWEHHLSETALANAPIMALLPDNDTLWVATQDRGVLGWNGTAWRTLDERAGLPDDWVTTLVQGGAINGGAGADDALLVGTFVGGMVPCTGDACRAAQLSGEAITALEPDGQGGFFVGTRHGLWQRNAAGDLHSLRIGWLDSEVQALCRAPGGLWVGTRTSLNFVTDATLQADIGAVTAASSSGP